MIEKDIKYEVFTDGAAKGINGKGPAASGFVFYKGKELIYGMATPIGVATNNVAEYKGLLLALSYTSKQGVLHNCYYNTDSQLMARQINGEYQVKNEELIKLYDKVIDYLGISMTHLVRWVPREFNITSDELCNAAIKENKAVGMFEDGPRYFIGVDIAFDSKDWSVVALPTS
jgi:ribonuclease HI